MAEKKKVLASFDKVTEEGEQKLALAHRGLSYLLKNSQPYSNEERVFLERALEELEEAIESFEVRRQHERQGLLAFLKDVREEVIAEEELPPAVPTCNNSVPKGVTLH